MGKNIVQLLNLYSMTKEEMLSAIYEAMADKTLSEWCIVFNKVSWTNDIVWNIYITVDDKLIEPHFDRLMEKDEYKVIWHPVRIGDVLKYIDTNCCFVDDGEWHKSRDMKALDALLHSLFYNFVGKQDRPIEEQDELCIEFVYNLIKK